MRAVRALGKLITYRLFVQERKKNLPISVAEEKKDYSALKQKLRQIALSRKSLSEFESRQVLEAFGIPVVKGNRAYTMEEAVSLAESIGYPVVVKINSAFVPHKSDVGGVVLNVRSAEEVRAAYTKITESVRRHLGNEVALDGVLVQKMEHFNAETFIGVKSDPVFGPAIAFGMGGVFIEVFKDVSLRIAPIDRYEATRMLWCKSAQHARCWGIVTYVTWGIYACLTSSYLALVSSVVAMISIAVGFIQYQKASTKKL